MRFQIYFKRSIHKADVRWISALFPLHFRSISALFPLYARFPLYFRSVSLFSLCGLSVWTTNNLGSLENGKQRISESISASCHLSPAFFYFLQLLCQRRLVFFVFLHAYTSSTHLKVWKSSYSWLLLNQLLLILYLTIPCSEQKRILKDN